MVNDWKDTLAMIDALRERGATSVEVDGVKVQFAALTQPPRQLTAAELEAERKAAAERAAKDDEETLNWSAT